MANEVSDVEVLPEEPAVEAEPVEEEVELVSTTLPNGLELFLAYKEETPTLVMQNRPDLPVFYVLGESVKDKASLFKVTCAVLGYVVTAHKENIDAPMGLAKVEARAVYAMPPIPLELINKVDIFFRAVDDKYKTEAIVLLSWDAETSEWGILIPTQANSAAHCDYKPDSIVDDKPDHVMIVGSIHSHPGMAAYASSTDHSDQADFDGVHITFGYPYGKGLEFHIEMQMGGGQYTLKPEQVFEPMPEIEPFPDLDEWMEKVTKQATVTTNPTGGYPYQSSGALTHIPRSSTSIGATKTDPKDTLKKAEVTHLFRRTNVVIRVLENKDERSHASCPNPAVNTIVVRVEAWEKKCPVCCMPLDSMALPHRRCVHCSTFFLSSSVENLADILNIRSQKSVEIQDIDVDNANNPPGLPVLLWKRSHGPYDSTNPNVRKIVSGACEVLYRPAHVTEDGQLPFLD